MTDAERLLSLERRIVEINDTIGRLIVERHEARGQVTRLRCSLTSDEAASYERLSTTIDTVFKGGA